MNNIVINKIKHFPQLFTLGLKIDLKRKCHYFLSWSTITTKLNIHTYKYKVDYISKGLLQAISLVRINIWLNFLLETNTYLHQILMP